MFFESFILSCYNKNYPMRMTTLYHLLKGKKTSSVLSFGYFYGILNFFGLFPRLKEIKYYQLIDKLLAEEYLSNEGNGRLLLTDKGQQQLDQTVFPKMNDLTPFVYNKWDILFWEKLLFATQVISEKSYLENNYVPVENNLFKQQQLKKWLLTQKSSLPEQLRDEWLKINCILSEEEKILIFRQLVGHEMSGMTLTQLANDLQKDATYVYIGFKNVLHRLMSEIIKEHDEYQLMYQLLILERSWLKEDSSVLSARLFKETHSIIQVGQVRHLKESTVTDHLIEDYLKFPKKDKIPYFSKLTKEGLEKLRQELPDYRQWKFKEAREFLPELTFYNFRFYQFYLIEEEKNG